MSLNSKRSFLPPNEEQGFPAQNCPLFKNRQGLLRRKTRPLLKKDKAPPTSECLQFISSSPPLQSTRPSHLLQIIIHCQKCQTYLFRNVSNISETCLNIIFSFREALLKKKCFLSGIARKGGGGETPARIF